MKPMKKYFVTVYAAPNFKGGYPAHDYPQNYDTLADARSYVDALPLNLAWTIDEYDTDGEGRFNCVAGRFEEDLDYVVNSVGALVCFSDAMQSIDPAIRGLIKADTKQRYFEKYASAHKRHYHEAWAYDIKED